MKPIERFLRETDRVPLMPMPTPLHPMHYQPSGKDVSLLIKRDDMTGVGPGGNKIRSLEFLLGEARSKGASKILAAGPEQSNLCALTAAACAKAGLDCELIINAAEPARKEGNLLLEELVGNIYDEFDPQEEQDIIRLEDNKWRVSGSADLEELAEALDLDLSDEDLDYDTLGGLVFSQLSVIPDDGSRPIVEALGLRIQVEELCDRRVEWALVEKLEQQVPTGEPAPNK